MSEWDVLVLEDNALIARHVALTLRRGGYGDVVVCHSARDAGEALGRGTPRAAVLDFDLGHGETSLAIARRLQDAGIGFLFLSGYSGDMLALPSDMRQVPCLLKPLQGGTLLEAVGGLTGRDPGG